MNENIISADEWVSRLSHMDVPASKEDSRPPLTYGPDTYPLLPETMTPFDTVLEHWKEIRPDGMKVPYKNDLQISKLKSVLSEVLLLEVKEDGDLHVRLRATDLKERSGAVVADGSLLSIHTPAMQAHLKKESNIIQGTPCGLFEVMLQHYGNGSSLPVEVFSLPMAKPDGEVAFSLTVTHLRDKKTEYRLRLYGVTGWTFMGARFIDLGYGTPPPLYVERQV